MSTGECKRDPAQEPHSARMRSHGGSPAHAPANVGRRLAKRIRLIRIARGLSQAEAARRADIHRLTWNRWEAGIQCPAAAHVPLIALALSCTLEDLFDVRTGGDDSTVRAA